MRLKPDIYWQNRLAKWTEYLVLIVLVITVLALAGWLFNIELLKRIVPDSLTKHPVTVLGLRVVFLGIICYNIVLLNRRDILRKDVQNRFEDLLESAPDAMVIVDEQGKIVLVNRQTVSMFGYNRQELIGQQVEVLIPADMRSRHTGHRENYSKEPRTRSMGAGMELEALKKGGQKFPVEISLSPLRTNEGTLISASIRDITERKIINEQLKKTNQELEAFTYSVSHDLRAPLRGIIGFTSILEEDYTSKLDDEAKRITNIIKANTLKMAHLIDDLLAFSRLGRKEILKTSINTGQMVEEVIQELSSQNNNTLTWNIQSLPPVKGDLHTLKQVWINLISNAIKYSSGKGNAAIEISSYSDNGQIVFFVKDNGVGFDERYKDKLFKVFQRLHSADEFEGTGVGLAIVEKIISKHGGKVWATSELNKGACFYFSLPGE